MGFNLPEGRDGFKRRISRTKSLTEQKCFNLPEGRDGFKRRNSSFERSSSAPVSIYPKAEMGLRVQNLFMKGYI